jgi:chemotaxis protein MotB
MARGKKHPTHENHERWLVSYADFITLLFAFFVVMFATSQTDRGKTHEMEEAVKKALKHDQVVSAISAILGGAVDDKGKGNAQRKGPGGVRMTALPKKETEMKYAELLPAMQYLTKELEREVKEGKMQISMEARGLVVSFSQSAFFPSGGDEIPELSFPAAVKVAEVIKKLPNPIRCEGHTDAIPLRGGGRFRTNWELSAARAVAMMELLTECCALSKQRFSIGGYADNVPVSDNSTEVGRRRNRRVDIVILNQAGDADEPTAVRK